MNLPFDDLDAETFEPIRRARRFTPVRARHKTTRTSGVHRRNRRHWRPLSKSALSAHCR